MSKPLFRRIQPRIWPKRQRRYQRFLNYLSLKKSFFFDKQKDLWQQGQHIKQDFFEFSRFLFNYSKKKLTIAALYFETVKDYLVFFLVTKRGRHSKSFLNLSFVILTVASFIVAPVIASSYPGVNEEQLSSFSSPSAIATSLDQLEMGVTTVVSAKPRDQVISYRVQKGDTLSSIAKTFAVSEDSIKWASNLKSDKLSISQEVKIPPVTGVIHKVAEGETIYQVAKKYKTEPQKIVNFPFNDFEDLDTFSLRIGQLLVVPDGVVPEAPAIARIVPVPEVVAGPAGVYIWPTQGGISQYPVWYHMAVDIADKGAPLILASRAGVVSYSGCLTWGYGCHIIIDHGDGHSTLYGHLSRLDVSAGGRVGQGTVIGRMGSTGRSTGTHLHFEIRRNGIAVNPLPFLQR